jgi:hypothetical protein
MTIARTAWLVPVLVIAFLTVGVPRWLTDNGRPAIRDGAAMFTAVCRQHGGTLVSTPASASVPTVPHSCVVRYGRSDYVMDAVTPHGWDTDAARLQREGCGDAARRASTARPKSRVRFVYHSFTGVCESG